MPRRKDARPPGPPRDEPRKRPELIVLYDWEARQYWLAVKGTTRRVAGPFPSSFEALDYAAAGLPIDA